MIIDIFMSVMLVLLMAYQVTGNKYHEWIGTGMILLFLIHNVLNHKWYQALFKGKWSLQRCFRTLINLSVLISFAITAYGGMEMSRYVFRFLPDLTRVSIARKMHLAGSYWTFTLISLHIGIHWNQMSAIMQKILERKRVLRTILGFISLSVAIWGVILLVQADIFDYMLLKIEYVSFDYEAMPIVIFLKNSIMMWSIGYIGYLFMRILGRTDKYFRRKRNNLMVQEEINHKLVNKK